jgi:phosphate-selective porin
MNGRGLKVKDDNSKKDFIGRITYKFTDFMTIGGSFRYGYPIPNNNDDSRTTYGGEIALVFNNLKIQSEYIYDKGASFSGAGGGCGAEPVPLGEKRDGAYAMIYYDTKWHIQPVFKYEYFDSNIDVKDIGYQEMMTIGANYFFNDKIRLQINYQAHIETINNVDNDMLLAQLQVKF